MDTSDHVEKYVYSVEEVQVILGIGRAQAYELVKSNAFPCRKVGRRLLIPIEPFEKWLYSEEKENIESF